MMSPMAYRCGSAVCMLRVDLDDGPLDDRLGRLQPHVVGVRGAAGRDQQPLDDQLGRLLALLAHQDVDAGLVRRHGRGVEAGAGDDLDAPLGERLLHLLGDLGVLEGHDGRQVLQHGHLGAQVAVVGGELDAHRAAADDRDASRARRPT